VKTLLSLNGVRLECGCDPLAAILAWVERLRKKARRKAIDPKELEREWKDEGWTKVELGSHWTAEVLQVFSGKEGGYRIASARYTRIKRSYFSGNPEGSVWYDGWRAVREAADLLRAKGIEAELPKRKELIGIELLSPRWLPGPTEVRVGGWRHPAWGKFWEEVEEMEASSKGDRGLRMRLLYALHSMTGIPRSTWSAVMAGKEADLPNPPPLKQRRWASSLEEAIEVDLRSGYRTLFSAIRARDFEALRLMLEWKADADEVGRDGITPLALALELGWTEGAVLLLRHGAALDDRALSRASGKTLAKLVEKAALPEHRELEEKVLARLGSSFLGEL